MKNVSEYDERQLILMLNQLDAFENKKLDLSSLVGRLEGLLHAMEHVTDEWEEKFLDEFSTLESINAEAPKLKEEEIEKLIKSSICNLKKLVKEKLMKVLYWDTDGLAIWFKRLEKGSFPKKENKQAKMTRREFLMLLEGVTPKRLQPRFSL